MTTKVSVIVPTYNCDRYIAQLGSRVLAYTKTVAICKVEKILPNLSIEEENMGKKVSKFKSLFQTN